jgi:hypothetical protein
MDISNNEYNFDLPSTLGETLPHLEIFFAENNKLIGNIPSSLGDLNLSKSTPFRSKRPTWPSNMSLNSNLRLLLSSQ